MKGSSKQAKHKNCSCKKKYNLKGFPLVITILLAVLPKCPFCIMAYSSAIMMCSGTVYSEFEPNWFSYLSSLLSLVILTSLVFNNRGRITKYAFLMAMIGSLLVIYSQLISGVPIFYWIGTNLLMIAALLNGNFIPLIRQLSNWMNVKKEQKNASVIIQWKNQISKD